MKYPMKFFMHQYEIAMKYSRHKNEISNESARHPYEIAMKYPRHKNEIS